MLNREQIVSRRNGIETRTMQGGAVLVDMNTGACFRLNRVGADLWSLLETPRSIDELCARLRDHHRRSPDDAERDVSALLDQMRDSQLINDVPPSS